MPVDVCDIVSDVIDAVLNMTNSNIICKITFEAEVRVIGKPLKKHQDLFNNCLK